MAAGATVAGYDSQVRTIIRAHGQWMGRSTAAGSAMPAHDPAAGTEDSIGQDAWFGGATGGAAAGDREGVVLGQQGHVAWR